MIGLLLFLVSVDSLPPIPDLSQVIFPEPHLWLEPAEKSVELGSYGGQYFGGLCDIMFKNFGLSALYDQREDWDSVICASGTLSCSIPLAHLFLKPSVNGLFHKRDDEYRLLCPNLNMAVNLSWAIILATTNADLWQINSLNYQEYTAGVNLIFDRVIYLPHFEIRGIYSGKKLEPNLTGKLHIRKLHLSVGSWLSQGFPSPTLNIQYLNPKVKVGASFRTGPLIRTLKQKFDPALPLQYRISMPSESLKTGVALDLKLDLYHHSFQIIGSYNSWREKLAPGQGFIIKTKGDVEELNICVTIKDDFTYRNMHFENSLCVTYNWSDTIIAFVPRHTACDTISIGVGPIVIAAEAVHYAARDGIVNDLAPLFMINPSVACRYKIFKVFLTMHNATDETEQIYDGYFLTGRQYAAGLVFSHAF